MNIDKDKDYILDWQGIRYVYSHDEKKFKVQEKKQFILRRRPDQKIIVTNIGWYSFGEPQFLGKIPERKMFYVGDKEMFQGFDDLNKAIEEIVETGIYEKLGEEVGRLVDKKNAAYGNSFNESAKILSVLYPDGVKVSQYADMLCVIRILDKMFRIANNKRAFDESPYRDIAGYGLLGLKKDNDIGSGHTCASC